MKADPREAVQGELSFPVNSLSATHNALSQRATRAFLPGWSDEGESIHMGFTPPRFHVKRQMVSIWIHPS